MAPIAIQCVCVGGGVITPTTLSKHGKYAIFKIEVESSLIQLQSAANELLDGTPNWHKLN